MSVAPCSRPANSASPLVSVVVVTYNSRPHLNDLLGSLRAQTMRNFELLVLDSASTDDTATALRGRWMQDATMPPCRVISAPANLGYREGNRAAIQFATGKYLLVLNDDVELHPQLLEELVACAEKHPRIAMVAPAILLHGSASRLNAAGSDLLASGFYAARAKDDLLEHHCHEADLVAVSGCAFLVRRDALDDPQAFASVYGQLPSGWHASAEDLDFCWRLLARGGQIRYQPRAILWHKYQQKPLDPQRFASLIGGRLLFVWLNFPRTLLLRLAPLLLATECALFSYAACQWLRTRRWEHLRAWWRTWAWLWYQRRNLADIRARRQQAAKRPTPELASYFAASLPLNPTLRQGFWLRASISLWFLANRCFRHIACIGAQENHLRAYEDHAAEISNRCGLCPVGLVSGHQTKSRLPGSGAATRHTVPRDGHRGIAGAGAAG
jgi:GT2 family glycosyltransferase